MFCCRRTTVAVSVLLGLVSACRPAGYALLQRQPHAFLSEQVIPPDSLPELSELRSAARPAPTLSVPTAVPRPAAASVILRLPQKHLRNPEASDKKPRKLWLQQSGLLEPMETTYVHEQPVVVGKRRIPILAHGAFAGSALSYLASTISSPGGWVWLLVTTLPLLSALIGIAGLTKIHRNREQYRGKAWAISAILLGTGVIGMAWVAIIALSTSKAFWG